MSREQLRAFADRLAYELRMAVERAAKGSLGLDQGPASEVVVGLLKAAAQVTNQAVEMAREQIGEAEAQDFKERALIAARLGMAEMEKERQLTPEEVVEISGGKLKSYLSKDYEPELPSLEDADLKMVH